MNATEIATIAIAVVTFLLTGIMTLAAYIWHSTMDNVKNALDELRKQNEVNGRHMDSIIHTTWLLVWRTNNIEDFLAEQMQFRPPRIIGNTETFGTEGSSPIKDNHETRD